MKLPRLRVTALLLLTCLVTTHAQAQIQENVISVTAEGQVKIRPDTIVIKGSLTESSEKMNDAVTAFSDTRRRALAAITQSEIPNLTASAGALSMSLAGDPSRFDDFGIEVKKKIPKGSLVISQSVRLQVTGIDKLKDPEVMNLVVKLLTATKDAGIEIAMSEDEAYMMMQMGMDMGSGGGVIFQISDPDNARKQAMRAAVEKAKADAQFLAELAGGKLGPVVGISDDFGDQNNYDYYYDYGYSSGSADESDRYSNNAYDPISVTRTLTIGFRLIAQ